MGLQGQSLTFHSHKQFSGQHNIKIRLAVEVDVESPGDITVEPVVENVRGNRSS